MYLKSSHSKLDKPNNHNNQYSAFKTSTIQNDNNHQTSSRMPKFKLDQLSPKILNLEYSSSPISFLERKSTYPNLDTKNSFNEYYYTIEKTHSPTKSSYIGETINGCLIMDNNRKVNIPRISLKNMSKISTVYNDKALSLTSRRSDNTNMILPDIKFLTPRKLNNNECNAHDSFNEKELRQIQNQGFAMPIKGNNDDNDDENGHVMDANVKKSKKKMLKRITNMKGSGGYNTLKDDICKYLTYLNSNNAEAEDIFRKRLSQPELKPKESKTKFTQKTKENAQFEESIEYIIPMIPITITTTTTNPNSNSSRKPYHSLSSQLTHNDPNRQNTGSNNPIITLNTTATNPNPNPKPYHPPSSLFMCNDPNRQNTEPSNPITTLNTTIPNLKSHSLSLPFMHNDLNRQNTDNPIITLNTTITNPKLYRFPSSVLMHNDLNRQNIAPNNPMTTLTNIATLTATTASKPKPQPNRFSIAFESNATELSLNHNSIKLNNNNDTQKPKFHTNRPPEIIPQRKYSPINSSKNNSPTSPFSKLNSIDSATRNITLTRQNSYINPKKKSKKTRENSKFIAQIEGFLQNYRVFYDNIAKYNCSDCDFKRVIGDSPIIRNLFESKIKGKFSEPPTSQKLINMIKGVVAPPKKLSLNSSSVRRASLFTSKAQFQEIDPNTIKALKEFNERIEEMNLEYQLTGIQTFQNGLFKLQNEHVEKEKEVLSKIYKANFERFINTKELCEVQHNHITPNLNYNFSSRMEELELKEGELEYVSQRNKKVNKEYDNLYEKWFMKCWQIGQEKTILAKINQDNRGDGWNERRAD